MLQSIDVSQARKNLSQLMEAVFFKRDNFILARRGIPMAKLIPVDKITKPVTKRVIDTSLFGIWRNRKESTSKLARKLRVAAWER